MEHLSCELGYFGLVYFVYTTGNKIIAFPLIEQVYNRSIKIEAVISVLACITKTVKLESQCYYCAVMEEPVTLCPCLVLSNSFFHSKNLQIRCLGSLGETLQCKMTCSSRAYFFSVMLTPLSSSKISR